MTFENIFVMEFVIELVEEFNRIAMMDRSC